MFQFGVVPGLSHDASRRSQNVADLEASIIPISQACFRQTCLRMERGRLAFKRMIAGLIVIRMATRRVFLQRSAFERLREAIVTRRAAVRAGPPASQQAMESMPAFIRMGGSELIREKRQDISLGAYVHDPEPAWG